MQKKIRKRRTYLLPVEEVWDALSNGKKLDAWFMENNFNPVEGASFEFFDKPGEKWRGLYQGEIISCQPPVNLAFSWTHKNLRHTTYVWWRLDEEKRKTVLSLEHSGFKGLSDYFKAFTYSRFWDHKLKDLLHFLTKEPNTKDPIKI